MDPLPPGPINYSFPIIVSPMIGISSAKKAKSATYTPRMLIDFIMKIKYFYMIQTEPSGFITPFVRIKLQYGLLSLVVIKAYAFLD